MTIKVCPNGHRYLAEKHSTCPYCGKGETKNSVSGEKTQISWDQETFSAEPLLGWLICIEGEDKGTDYPLRGAVSSIGRNETAKVKLSDKTVGRSGAVASAAYDKLGRKFYLTKGDAGANIIAYLNGKPLVSTAELNAYDRIRIGETTLLFMPFCGSNFNWDQE